MTKEKEPYRSGTKGTAPTKRHSNPFLPSHITCGTANIIDLEGIFSYQLYEVSVILPKLLTQS